MNKHKPLLVGIAAILALGTYYFQVVSSHDKLTIGLFAGSPWSNINSDLYDVVDDVIAKYNQNYDIEVEYINGILKDDYENYLNSMIVAGHEPDIYLILDDDFPILSGTNFLTPLDSFMNNDATFDFDYYYPASLAAGQNNGITYALPVDCNLDLLFVNESLLEQEGITIDGQLDLDDFYDICAKVTRDTNGDGMIDQFGFCNYTLDDVLATYDFETYGADSISLDVAATKNAIEYYKKLIAINQGFEVTLDDFDSGRVVFAKLPFSQFRTYRFSPYNLTKYSTFKWDCINLPTDTAKSGELDTLLMGISSRCKDKYAAFRLLKLLSNDPDIQQEYFQHSQGISPLQNIVSSVDTNIFLNEESLDSDFDFEVIDTAMDQAFNPVNMIDFNLIKDQLSNLLVDGLTTDEDIDLYLMDVQRQINQLLIAKNK